MTAKSGPGAPPAFFFERRVARLRQGRQARSFRLQLRRLVDREGSLLLARRNEQELLHAGEIHGPDARGFITISAREFEDVTEKAGVLDPTSKSLGVAIVVITTRTAGRIFCRQRHATEQAVQQHGKGLYRTA